MIESPVRRSLLAFCLGMVFAVCGTAQRFSDLPTEMLPIDNVLSQWVDAGDIDGDLDVDLVFIRNQQPALVYRNEGSGRFSEHEIGPSSPNGITNVGASVLVDVDGDGDLDLVITRSIGPPVLWRNDGATWQDVTAVQMPSNYFGGDVRQILAGDVDGDGDQDLFMSSNTYRMMINDGNGNFVWGVFGVTTLPITGGEGALVDIDEDGDLDYVGSRSWYQNAAQHVIFLNNGSGSFLNDQSELRLPATTEPTGGTLSMAVGDVDGDGDVDLVSAQGPNTLDVYRNTGGGFFPAVESLPIDDVLHSPYDRSIGMVRLADFDADGDLDCTLVQPGGYGRHLFLNDGTGTFSAAPREQLPQSRGAIRAQVVVDVDSDGDLDIVQATPRLNFAAPWPVNCNPVLFNDGRGHFFDPGSDAIDHTLEELQCVAAVDFDRDGLVDIIRGTASNGAGGSFGMLWADRNSGEQRFVENARIPYPQDLGSPRSLAVADFDGDGWPDFYAGTYENRNLLFRNQGDGSFALHAELDVTDGSASVALFGDFDGDGDVDLLAGMIDGSPWSGGPRQTRYWSNDGAGNFADETSVRLPIMIDRIRDMAVIDIGNDGDLDVVALVTTGQPTSHDRVLINDGSGVFVDEPERLPDLSGSTSSAVGVADFNQDGFADLMIQKSDLNLLLGNAAGTFTDVSGAWSTWFWSSYEIRIADLDLDGDLDLFRIYDDPQVLRNTGSAFELLQDVSSSVFPSVATPAYSMMADFDGDGDTDIVYGGSSIAHAQWNLHRHLSLPMLAKPGTSMPIRIYAQPEQLPSPMLAVVAVSFGRQRSVTPFGTLWVDPLAPLDLQSAVVPAPSGIAEVSLPIPNWNSLNGTKLTVQALLLDGSATQLDLTNAITTTIR